MKKKIIATIVLLIAIGIIAVKLFQPNSKSDNSQNLNKALNVSATKDVKDDIYIKGKNVSIAKWEVELSQKFYQLSGSDEKQAKEQAEQYQKQENALYAKALSEGYTVTDEEVYKFLDSLKQSLAEADNRKEVEKIIKSYGLEDNYWDYMFKVYKKALLTQKYVSDLENDYAEQLGMDKTSEEFEKQWNKKLESIKDDLVKKEDYTIVKVEG